MAEETEPQDLSHLSPQAVLGTPSAPPPPPYVPPPALLEPQPAAAPPLTREELLRQASEASDTELILPPPPVPVDRPAPVPPRRLPPPPMPPVPPAASAPAESSKLHVPTIGPDIETMHARRAAPNVGRIGRTVAAAGGLAVLLVAIAGISYVLVLRGTRIPLLYPAVSHLAANGLGQRDRAMQAVTAASSYQYASGSQISLRLKSGAAAALGSTVSPVASITTTLQSGQVALPAEQLAAKVSVAGSGAVQVPLLFVTGTADWKVRLPLNAAPTDRQVAVPALRSSFLAVAIQPLPLSSLLKAAAAETGYRQETIGGQRSAVYAYALDQQQLDALLPSGVTATDQALTVTYAWGNDRPTAATVTATLSDAGTGYAYAATYGYAGWNATLSDSDLTELQASTGPDLPVSDLTAQLGFAAGSLPGDTASVPVPPTVQASVPSGQFTTQLLPAITATPPPPATAATAQMLTDDTQRKTDLKLLQTALGHYKNDHGGYPKSQGLEQVQASQALLSALVPTYLTALPIDPTLTVYWYEYQSDGSTFAVRSVAQNPADPLAKLGTAYHYFEFTNSTP